MVLTVISLILIPPALAVIREHVTAAASESTTKHHQVSSPSCSIAALKTVDAPSSIATSADHRQSCSEAHSQTPLCVAQKVGAASNRESEQGFVAVNSVSITLTLGLDFSMAGEEGSAARAGMRACVNTYD